MRKRHSRDHPENIRGVCAKAKSVFERVAVGMLLILAVGAVSALLPRLSPEPEVPEAPPGITEPSVPDKPGAPTGPTVEVIMPANPEGDTSWKPAEFEWE